MRYIILKNNNKNKTNGEREKEIYYNRENIYVRIIIYMLYRKIF